MLGLSISISIGDGGKGPLWSGWAGLTHSYPLDETSGTRYDNKGTVNLTATNNPGYGTGKHNNAAAFVAASVQSLSSTSADFKGNASFTWSAWVKKTAGSTGTFIARDDGGANRDYFIFFNVSNSILFYHSNGALPSLTQPVSDGGWNFIVFGIDYGAGNQMFLSVNGGTLVTGAHAAALDVTTPLVMGTGAWGSLDGLIDEPCFFNVVKDQAWITAMYNGGAGKFYPS